MEDEREAVREHLKKTLSGLAEPQQVINNATVGFSDAQNALAARVHALQEAVRVVIETISEPLVPRPMGSPTTMEITDKVITVAKQFEKYLTAGEQND